MSKTTASHIAAFAMDNWTIPYGIPTNVLTDSRTQFVSKFFQFLCAFLGRKRLTTTAYHLQTNRQAEPFNKRLIARLPNYVPYH